MSIEVETVRTLIFKQCPQWSQLDIRPVENNGHDNDSFYLGDQMIIRIPSGKDYAVQIDKEAKWLPYLSKQLTLLIPTPIYRGKPSDLFEFPWAVLKYIDGETVNKENIDSNVLATELSGFLKELQSIDVLDAPKAGQHNFYRGGHLSVYTQETKDTLRKLNLPQTDLLQKLWDKAIKTTYQRSECFVHGDIAPTNLLVQNGHLKAVIDFGILGVGDPACDYAMAWTFFDKTSRNIFLKGQPQDLIERAMGWALWKALITYNDLNETLKENARKTIQEIMEDNQFEEV